VRIKSQKATPVYFLAVCAAFACLSGCNNSPKLSPLGFSPPTGMTIARSQIGAEPLDPMFTSRETIAHGSPYDSWKDSKATGEDLLYVSDVRTVTVYSYPEGRYEGRLRHFYIASGMCADVAGDVFITDSGYGKVFEYAHGGTKRIQVIDSPAGAPVGCSIDRTTGNLAVSTFGRGSGPAVAIFKQARGKAIVYQDSSLYEFYFCGYDGKGNLFVDGLSAPGTGHFALAELPKGGSALKTITANQYIGWPGGVQWDGKHVAIGDQITPVIYQFSIKGAEATKIGSTTMGSGASDVAQFFIQGQTLIAPNQVPGKGGSGSKALFYKYPTGGTATKEISKHVEAAHGVVVSLAPK
jgi:hypothetical protein